MELDPNWIVAIIGISAIIFPTISTWLNNYYQLKLKKIDMFEKCKYQAVENFTKSFENYYNHETTRNKIEFESSIANLFIYFSIPNYKMFDKLKECIKENDYEKTQFALAEIVRYLSSQIDK